MTDLLSRASSRPSTAAPQTGRPLALGAVLAGVGAPAVALSLLWFVGLVGWYADDGGSHGTTRSVLRVGADAWLLAHGSPLTLHHVVVTASPLGLTLLCGYLTYRLARRAGAASDVDDLRTVGLGTVVLSGSYAAVALLTAVLAGSSSAEPGMGAAFLGGALVGGLFGGLGLLRGAGRGAELRRLIPVPALSIGYAAVTTVLLMTALGALLTAVGLVVHWSAAVEVVDQLRLDLTGGLLSLVLLAAVAPNVVLLAASYLLGSGFAFGAGTVISPAQVELGPVPSVPVLAALPDNGWNPGWAIALIAVPVLAAAAAAFVTGRTLPTSSYQSAAGRGLGAGLRRRRPAHPRRGVRRRGDRPGTDGRHRGPVRRDADGRGGRPGVRRGARRAARLLVDAAAGNPGRPPPGALARDLRRRKPARPARTTSPSRSTCLR